MNPTRLLTLIALAAALPLTASAQSKKLKVFILAGQSNMQGQAMVSTIDAVGKDPKTAPLYQAMVGKDGQPKTCDHTWITYLSADRDGKPAERNGRLTAGFGATPEKIGPEFTFGIYLEQQVKEPILLIKTAWGGKSLHTDFRPPGGGTFEFNPAQLARFKAQGKDPAAEQAAKVKATGAYYRQMMEQVKKVLAEPQKYCPAYDPQSGYELAGFVWFQGWNDLVDSGVYPDRGQPGGYDLYSKLLAQFIRGVRGELKSPQLPFVIGVLGVGGPVDPAAGARGAPGKHFREAMAAPANGPDFKDSVRNVLTETYWDPLQDAAVAKKQAAKSKIDKMKKDGHKFAKGEDQALVEKLIAETCTPEELAALAGVSNQGYHYLGSAKILGGIGKGFAEAMADLLKTK
jgi:alpha-galactosidase